MNSLFLSYVSRLQNLDGDLVSISRFNETLEVAASGLLRDPARLFGVIGLGLELGLQLGSNDQPGLWVWIGSSALKVL